MAAWDHLGNRLDDIRASGERPSFSDEQYADAWAYASLLTDGEEILEHVDGDHIGPFRYWLPSCLAKQGKCLEQIPGGWKVRVRR